MSPGAALQIEEPGGSAHTAQGCGKPGGTQQQPRCCHCHLDRKGGSLPASLPSDAPATAQGHHATWETPLPAVRTCYRQGELTARSMPTVPLTGGHAEIAKHWEPKCLPQRKQPFVLTRETSAVAFQVSVWGTPSSLPLQEAELGAAAHQNSGFPACCRSAQLLAVPTYSSQTPFTQTGDAASLRSLP